jgi:hypothetical protein
MLPAIAVAIVVAVLFLVWWITGRPARGACAYGLTAGYAGVSVPVVGLAPALQQLSPRVTLLIFALAVGRGIIGSALRQAQAAADERS